LTFTLHCVIFQKIELSNLSDDSCIAVILPDSNWKASNCGAGVLITVLQCSIKCNSGEYSTESMFCEYHTSIIKIIILNIYNYGNCRETMFRFRFFKLATFLLTQKEKAVAITFTFRLTTPKKP
jgi:hypothetical protein